ncbi:hypothetical protein AWC38_SpisGene10308 [Stylophora pistillata]|uniref:Uncharacterized protein n=1 Tax=Stylophora pistillata TaxID=50429 RepID=A0A2B4S930_STYPI|nr:hypothetical protein AWC38_SpisGene10308 [Stylophora pistillata]
MRRRLKRKRQRGGFLGVGPEASEDGGEQGNLLDSVQENLMKDLIRSVKTGKEPTAAVGEETGTPSTSKKKKKQIITPMKLFSTSGSSATENPIRFRYGFMSLKDLPFTPILTGKRLLPSTPLGASKSAGHSAHKTVQKKGRIEQVWEPWGKRGWDPVKAVQHAEYKAPNGNGKGKGKGKK